MLLLAAPAAFMAGLAAGGHCALMCGPLQARALRARAADRPDHALAALHAGRIAGYTGLGAAAGGSGGTLALLLPSPAAGTVLQALFGAALLGFAVVQWRARPGCCPPRGKPTSTGGMAMRGALWAAAPCPTLYALLPLAGFTGSAESGAALLAAFGAGTLPLLAASGRLLGNLGLRSSAVASATMAASGLVALALAWVPAAMPAWCRALL